MTLLATMPGKFGDIIWALPSVRALAEATGAPVDLAVAAESASICPLLEAQPYIGKAWAIPEWIGLAEPHMPWQAPRVEGYEAQVDLGYRGWPDRGLPYYTYACAQAEAPITIADRMPPLDLATPWITTVPWGRVPHRIAIGFTDEHFELKYGLVRLLEKVDLQSTAFLLTAPNSRWQHEADTQDVGWIEAAMRIAAARVFVGCCSALHVLACGLGVPVVLMEPSPARHNDIFYPFSKGGPQVTLVLGNDGQPTYDARAVAAAVRQALERGR